MNQEIDIKKIEEELRKANMADWLNEWDIRSIASSVSRLEPGQTYVEIGVAHGASSAIASLYAKLGVNIYAIDKLNWEDRDKNIREFLAAHDQQPSNNYHFLHDDSQFLARFWDKGEIDVLYIDGDHTWQGVVMDIVSWFPWVKKGGTIIFDDYVDGGNVKRAINELLIDHKAFKETFAAETTFVIRK